jgi:hypothetical protein
MLATYDRCVSDPAKKLRENMDSSLGVRRTTIKNVARDRFCSAEEKKKALAGPSLDDGGRTRARTWDPLIKSQLLYQLSYAPGTGPEKTRYKRASFSKATLRCPANLWDFPGPGRPRKYRKMRLNPATLAGRLRTGPAPSEKAAGVSGGF